MAESRNNGIAAAAFDASARQAHWSIRSVLFATWVHRRAAAFA